MRRKTNPNHKATFSFGVAVNCSCGWRSNTWYGKGAQKEASHEWRWHLLKCEKVDATQV